MCTCYLYLSTLFKESQFTTINQQPAFNSHCIYDQEDMIHIICEILLIEMVIRISEFSSFFSDNIPDYLNVLSRSTFTILQVIVQTILSLKGRN